MTAAAHPLRCNGRDYPGVAALLRAAATGEIRPGIHPVWAPLPGGEYLTGLRVSGKGEAHFTDLEPAPWVP